MICKQMAELQVLSETSALSEKRPANCGNVKSRPNGNVADLEFVHASLNKASATHLLRYVHDMEVAQM